MLGLLFAKQGLTWQFPCCFMGQFLPDLGAGTQLTAAISQPNLITAVKSIQDPFPYWSASSQDHRRMFRREGFAWAEGGGQARLIPAGRTCEDAQSFPQKELRPLSAHTFPKKISLGPCQKAGSEKTWVLRLKSSLFLVFRRFNKENLKLKLPLKKFKSTIFAGNLLLVKFLMEEEKTEEPSQQQC